MSRSIIMGVVAVVIAALTATAYVATTSTQEAKIKKELRTRVDRARKQMHANAAIEALGVLRDVESLASQQGLIEALRAETAQGARDWNVLKRKAGLTIDEFFAGPQDPKARQKAVPRPDVLAVVDKAGDVVYMDRVALPTAGEFKDDKGKVELTPLAVALDRRIVISGVGRLSGVGLARVVVATIVDHEASAADGSGEPVIAGAVVAAYAITAKAARERDDLLGVRVAYFDEGVSATSFMRGTEENTNMHDAVDQVLGASGLRAKLFDGADELTGVTEVSLDGEPYLAAAVRLPRIATKDLPADYPRQDVGALVLVSVGDEAAAFTSAAKTFLLLLGAGALAIALFGMYLVHRRIEAQIDQVELGVAEIINGNLDRTFRPVGAELDGLSNGLNVMLARLLGRPEPGEEAYDENGNPIIPGKVDFEEAPEGEAAPAPAAQADPELAALAQEPEPDYYKRVFTEYVAARKESGSPDDVSFESFIAKLRVNEGKLKAQYQCRAVRFRVVMKDGKVTLKPVPIF